MKKTTLALAIASLSTFALAEPVEKQYVDSVIERINGYTTDLAKGQTYLGIRDGEQRVEIDGLTAGQAAQQTQLSNHEAALATQGSQLNQQTNQLNSHEATLTTHQSQLKEQAANQAATQSRVNQQGTVQKQQGETLVNHEGRITQQAALQQAQGATLTNHGNQLNLHANQLGTYGERLDGYDRQIVDMDTRYNAKWDELTAANHRQDGRIDEAMDMAAASYAAAALQFCTQQDCGLQVAGGAATLNGKQAIAVGLGGAVTEKLFLNINFVNSGSVRGGAVGATYSLR